MKIFAFLVCFVVFSIYETFGYNNTYPLTRPVKDGNNLKYSIAIISNDDERSKVGEQNKWRSKLKKGWVTVEKVGSVVKLKEISWAQELVNLDSNISSNGRAMEVSGLVTFNGKLYLCDKVTGIVYEIINGLTELREFVRLKTKNGSVFKCKWMVVRDTTLYVGLQAREWVDSAGEMNIVELMKVDKNGNVTKDYMENHYSFFREAAGYPISGYITAEAVNWSEKHKKWFFQPRTGSYVAGGHVDDETRGDNKLYITDESGKDLTITVKKIGPLEEKRRFTSFKFVPDSDDNIFVALKVTEMDNGFSTFIEAYDVNGNELLSPQLIANDKYEGLEFI